MNRVLTAPELFPYPTLYPNAKMYAGAQEPDVVVRIRHVPHRLKYLSTRSSAGSALWKGDKPLLEEVHKRAAVTAGNLTSLPLC